MPKQTNEDSARRLQRRLQPFLDCVAHLLAKRWLRDQRQQEEKPPPGEQEPPTEHSES
jgi:hypothetical protein